jgi:rhodanese-related sulfurtransferase
VTAVVLGTLAAFAANRDAVVDARVDAVGLAGWIKNRRPALRIVDVRSAQEFDEYHIPTAVRADIGSTGSPAAALDAPIVVYADTPAHGREASTALAARGYRHVSYLPGGVTDWLDQVMNASLPKNPSPEARAAFARARELCLFFGGVPRVDVDPSRTSISAQQGRRRGC